MVPATTFEQAKKRLEAEHFDIAILDVMDVNGYTLVEMAIEKKVIAVRLTAHGLSVEGPVKSLEKGAASYVPKEKMASNATFLNDILEAQAKGKSLMWRWLDRLDSYYEKRFGLHWKKDGNEFGSNFHIGSDELRDFKGEAVW